MRYISAWTTRQQHDLGRRGHHYESISNAASGPYSLYIDGEVGDEGPVRSTAGISAMGRANRDVEGGVHVVSVLCHQEAVDTRIQPAGRPFLRVLVRRTGGLAIPVELRVERLSGYRTGVRRINPEPEWIDWCDTAAIPIALAGVRTHQDRCLPNNVLAPRNDNRPGMNRS